MIGLDFRSRDRIGTTLIYSLAFPCLFNKLYEKGLICFCTTALRCLVKITINPKTSILYVFQVFFFLYINQGFCVLFQGNLGEVPLRLGETSHGSITTCSLCTTDTTTTDLGNNNELISLIPKCFFSQRLRHGDSNY